MPTKSSKRIIGIDPSTKLGWAVADRGGLQDCGLIHVKKGVHDYRIKRFHDLALQVVTYASRYNAELAIVEGYVHTGKFVNAGQYELGAILRTLLWQAGIPVVEVSPTSLKKFSTGKGTATKKQMVKAAQEKWSMPGKDDNVADAVGLVMMGLAFDGVPGIGDAEGVAVVSKLPEPLI